MLLRSLLVPCKVAELIEIGAKRELATAHPRSAHFAFPAFFIFLFFLFLLFARAEKFCNCSSCLNRKVRLLFHTACATANAPRHYRNRGFPETFELYVGSSGSPAPHHPRAVALL